MNKGMLKNVLIVLLVTITIFSVFKFISSLKEKHDLLNSLNESKAQVQNLEKEKQNLLQTLEKGKLAEQKLSHENSELKSNLRASMVKITKIFKVTQEAQKTAEQLNSQNSILKAENAALIDQTDKLKAKFSQVSQENEEMKVKLNSVTELKKAIRELKKQPHKENAEIKQTIEQAEKIVDGNRGFLMKDGQVTYPAKVKIEVTPAPKKE